MDSHSAGPSKHGYYCPPIPAYFSDASEAVHYAQEHKFVLF
jgi:hypothetical protein